MAPVPKKLRVKKHGLKGTEAPAAGESAGARVDPASVFIRGIPNGTDDWGLRTFFEARVGPTSQCFMIRDDYGLVTFRSVDDARRCLEDLQGVDFEGNALRLQAAKPKRQRSTAKPDSQVVNPLPAASATPATASSAPTVKAGRPEGFSKHDIRSVHLAGVPAEMKKEEVQAFIEERMPGGCGIEALQKRFGKESGGTYLVHFRKEVNAKRAVDVLNGAELRGQQISATFSALEASRQSNKAGRLIIRNLAFNATEKQVRKAFEKLGSLAEVSVPAKEGAKGNINRGFAFVQFSDPTLAQRAVEELNGAKICGRGVAVDFAVQADLYASLQREEQEAPKSEKSSGKPNKEPKPQKGQKEVGKPNEDADMDEEEDEEEEEEEEDEEEEAPAKKKAAAKKKGGKAEEKAEKKLAADDEVKRMKQLMGVNEEDNEDSQEEAEKPQNKAEDKDKPRKNKKDLRTPGFDVDQKRTVFVRNIPFEATAEDLKEALLKYGRVWNVKMVADPKGLQSHRGSAFVKFADAAGADRALAEEAEAEKKLKELSAVARKNDRNRELPAVEGFGVSLKGRRLVLKPAVTPTQVTEIVQEKKPKKGAALEDKVKWRYLLTVGEISENSEKWSQLSKSEQAQRKASTKERKFRINNSNFMIHPKRLSVRNLPLHVDVTKLREAVVRHLCDEDLEDIKGLEKKKDKKKSAEKLIVKASLVRNSDRKDASGARRSRGYGFMEFKDHESALKVLDFLNNNPKVFGGTRRPIVQFAIEDKRKLRMQQELFEKHGHKLNSGKDEAGTQPVEDASATDKGAAKTEGKGGGKGEGKGEGKGKGKGEEGEKGGMAGSWSSWKRKKKKKPGESRGRRQREKRRKQKFEAAEKEKAKEAYKAEKAKRDTLKRKEENIKRSFKPKKVTLKPDAAASNPARGKKRKQDWEMADDFELRAMEKFRRH